MHIVSQTSSWVELDTVRPHFPPTNRFNGVVVVVVTSLGVVLVVVVVVVVVLILNSVKFDVSFWKRKSSVSSASFLFSYVSSDSVLLTTEAGSPQLWMIEALAALRQRSIMQKQKWSGWCLRSSWK